MWKNLTIVGENQKRGEAGQLRGDKDFVMSRSQLVAFAECPAKWVAGEKVEEESKSMDFGSLVDCLSTAPENLWNKFAIQPATYPAVAKKKGEPDEIKPWNNNANFCKEWTAAAEAECKTVVSQKMFDEAQVAFSALKNNDSISDLINCSKKQVLITAEWHDLATGIIVPFSALLDLVPDATNPTWGKCLADIKTARNGNPATWARVCDDSGYDVQAAIYFDLYRTSRPKEDRTDFIHIVQENTFPFHVVNPPPAFSSEFLDWGRMKYKSALRLYCQCLKDGYWPGYQPVGIQYGNTQIISPDELWSYRKCAGMAEIKMPVETPKSYQDPKGDIIL